MAQKFDELEGGASTEENPDDEFIWTDDADEPGEDTLSDAQRQPVVLHDIPEFREFQSRSDQRVASLQAELARRDEALKQLRAEQRTIQDRLDADKMRNATPQQIHAHYQQRAERDATEQAALATGQELESQIDGRAGSLLQAVGMTRQTPGLRFVKQGESVDWRDYAHMLESVVEVQHRAETGAERGTGTEPETAATTQVPPEQPPAEVVAQATPATRGRVSTARGRKPVTLWSSYFKALDRIPRGDTHAVVSLRMEYQKKGLDFAKMPTRRRR